MLQALTRQTLREEIVATIMVAIFTGKFASGDRLQERELAQQLGVSRTPLREALLELDFLGIVSVQNYRGAIICPFEQSDLGDIYNTRGVLEAEAARLACGAMGEAEIERLLDQMQHQLQGLLPNTEWSEEAAKIDEDFHDLLWQKSGSVRLRKELVRYQGIIYTIRKCIGNKMQLQARAIEEHILILEALKQRNPDESAARMRYHVRKAGEHAINVMFPSKQIIKPK